jgi:hypothetical protein
VESFCASDAQDKKQKKGRKMCFISAALNQISLLKNSADLLMEGRY